MRNGSISTAHRKRRVSPFLPFPSSGTGARGGAKPEGNASGPSHALSGRHWSWKASSRSGEAQVMRSGRSLGRGRRAAITVRPGTCATITRPISGAKTDYVYARISFLGGDDNAGRSKPDRSLCHPTTTAVLSGSLHESQRRRRDVPVSHDPALFSTSSGLYPLQSP